MFKWAEKKGWCGKGTFENLRTADQVKRTTPGVRNTDRRKAAVWEEVKLVIDECPPVVGAMLHLQWLTGMRTGEVCDLRLDEIDRKGEVWLYRPSKHKMSHAGQERVVALGPECQRILEPWIKRWEECYLFPPSRRRLKPNARYKPEYYARTVSEAAKRLGIKLCPYQLRHAAKKRFTQEFGLDGARAALGQMSLATTDSYDHHQDLDVAVEIARKRA